MRKLFLLLSLIIGCNSLIAQKIDTTRINELITASQDNIDDSTKALYLSGLAIKDAKRLGISTKIGEALINKAQIYRHHLRYSKAIEYYDQVIPLYEKTGNEAELAALLQTSGRYYYELGNYKEAMRRYMQALAICEKLGLENETKAWLLRYIGSVFKRQGNQDKALEYYRLAYKAFDELKDPDGMASCVNNIGNVYGLLGQDSLQLVYYKQAVKIAEDNDLKWRAAIILDNIAGLYNNRNDFETALVYLDRSYNYLSQMETPDYTFLSVNFQYRARVYFLKKEYNEALKLLQESERLILKTEKKQKLELGEIYLFYSDLYAAMGDYKSAYNYYTKYDEIDDSLTNIETAVEVEKIQLQFEDEKVKQQERIKKEMEDVRYAGQQRVITILIFGSGILLFISFIIFHQKKKLSVANNNLAESLEKEKELGYLKSRFVSTASHQFRTPLTVIKASISLMEMHTNAISDEAKPVFKRLKDRVNEQVDNMTLLMNKVLVLSKINSGTIKPQFEDIDIVRLCEDICNEINYIQEDGRMAHFDTKVLTEVITVDPDLTRQAISNLLNNAFKYSRGMPPPNVMIQGCEGKLEVSIRDYGIGIPQDDLNHLFQPFFRASNTTGILGTGLGISVAKEYIEMMGGELYVKSEENKGSEFIIRFKSVA